MAITPIGTISGQPSPWERISADIKSLFTPGERLSGFTGLLGTALTYSNPITMAAATFGKNPFEFYWSERLRAKPAYAAESPSIQIEEQTTEQPSPQPTPEPTGEDLGTQGEGTGGGGGEGGS